jgi:hypothetical protein
LEGGANRGVKGAKINHRCTNVMDDEFVLLAIEMGFIVQN